MPFKAIFILFIFDTKKYSLKLQNTIKRRGGDISFINGIAIIIGFTAYSDT